MRLGRHRTLLRYPYEVRSAEEYFNEIGGHSEHRLRLVRDVLPDRNAKGVLPAAVVHSRLRSSARGKQSPTQFRNCLPCEGNAQAQNSS
jgi:hypothetical protein